MNGRPEYEYKIVEVNGDEPHLNLLGLSGWKLVQVLPGDAGRNRLPIHYFHSGTSFPRDEQHRGTPRT